MIICPNLSNPEVAKEFNEIRDAIEAVKPGIGTRAAYLIWSLNNGNSIDKAPNGAESLLFKSLVDYYEGDRSKAIVAKAKTYSTNFLKWFGNWTGEEDALPEIRKQNPYSSEITIGKASPDYDSADVNGAGAMFAIRKNGEYIGSIAVNAYYRKGGNIEPWGEKDTNYVSMSSVGDAVEIEKEFRGKGYGKAAYFEFAKLMADLGYILRSAPSKSRTPASTRVWESLVRDGYAKRVGDRYEFINWFGDQGRFKTTDTKNNLFTPSGEVNWDYFELLLDLYHNNQPDSMFSHGRYTLATRPENHFTGEKNTLNHIKFVTQSMLNLLEGKYDVDLPFVSEARASLQNQKDLMIIAAMFHDVAKPYRHGDIHGWESADILRDLLGIDYNNRVAEWAVRHHMPMPFSHKAEFNLSNPEAIEVAKNIARDAKRIGIDANTAINAFVLINAADIINGRELNVDDNWAKKAGEEGLKKYGGDISVKNVLSIELKEKVALLKKAFNEIKDEDFGNTVYNYNHQERFDYQAFPEGGREDKKLPYLNNTEYTGVSKVVDENGEPLVVWHGSRVSDSIEEFQNDNTFFADKYTAFSYTPFDAEDERRYLYPSFLNIKNPKNVDAKGNVWNDIDGKSTDDIVKELSENDGAIIVNLKDYSDFTPGNPELSESILEEAPLHTDYITLSRDQIKHIDNRDGEYTGSNIYHNLRDEDGNYEDEVPEDGNYEDEVPEVYSPYPEYDEELKLINQRQLILEKQFDQLKQERLKLNKELAEAKNDTISKKIITTEEGKIKFTEKPDHLVFIDNDTSIFGLVTARILFKGDTIESALLFPSKNMMRDDHNYYRIDNSIRSNTLRLVYEALSVMKRHNIKVAHSDWKLETGGIFSDPENFSTQLSRMEKILGVSLKNVVMSEKRSIEDETPYGMMTKSYYRMVFNIDLMLHVLPIMGHNTEIYDILNRLYEQPSISENKELLIKALEAKEKDIDEKQSEIQRELRDIHDKRTRKESDLLGLPFNVTQGSLIWLVLKYINEGKSKRELEHIVDEINYQNGSKIRINWKTKKPFGLILNGKDDIDKTVDKNISRIEAVVNYLNEKFGNRLTVKYIDEHDWLINSNLYDGSNSCIIGDTIYLRKSRMTTEIAAEEMLHTLIHGMKYGSGELGNKKLFDSLFKMAKQLFPKLWAEIQNVYKYNHDEELVTQVLARYFIRDFDRRDTYNIEDLILKFKQWFVKLFNTILEEFAGTYYATVGNINPILNFLDISDMIIAKNLKFDIQTIPEIHQGNMYNKLKRSTPLDDSTILHNISARQLAAQDESQRLIVRMNVLYKLYEKMKNKTSSQQKIADRIFQTLNKLKQNRNIAAVGIALEQAKLSLGQYDEFTGGPATMQTANIYNFLYNAKQNNFDGVEALLLVDMYRNTIKFYSDLISGIPSEQIIDLSAEDKNNIRDIKNLIEDHIMPLWIEAIMKVGDDIVDSQIDQEVESSIENREEMKKVAKDWLHKNMMYGDINAVTSYLYNYSYSSNPIIKLAFHLILHAEQLTLEEMHHIAPRLMKAYQKANSGERSITPGWQAIMMEHDDKGIPTGNFIRDLNYGLYLKDLNNFIKTLNLDFIDDYGFTYVIDDTGAVVNSLTGEFAEDEEWGSNGEMPKYVEYLRAIEAFKSKRVHRRFTGQYYMERLSRPYDGTIDPYSPEFKDTRFNHGLSPKTLKRYSYYQSNINYYLNKSQDPNNGLVYPEKLDADDKKQLLMWMTKLDDFTNIFKTDGSYKTGEDLKMAFEVRAWLKYIGLHTNSKHLQDQFAVELANAKNESIAKGDPKIYQDFLTFNALAGINPDYIEQTVGSLSSSREDNDLSTRGKILRQSLQDQVLMLLTYTRDLKSKLRNPLFWLRCKSADLAIEDSKEPNSGGWSKDMYEKFQNNFYYKDILYTTDTGFYIDDNGNAINPNDPNVKVLEEAGKLLTFRQYLINKYTDEAFLTGSVEGLIDESTGMLIDFSGLSMQEIRMQISSLLSYRKILFHDDGSVTETTEPLSIFLMLYPKTKTFFNKRTGRTEYSVIHLGERRFKDSVSSFRDTAFDPNESVSEKPNASFDGGRYDNSEEYSKMRNDKDVSDLYDILILTMRDSLDIFSTNRKFNYKLPLINARTVALFSRILKRGYSAKALQSIWQSMSTIEENDDDMRTKLDYFIGVDGEIANDIPIKFIRSIKDPELLSTDLVSSVILFADMAINYKNKSGIDATLKLLRYNMDPEIRLAYDKKLRPESELASSNNDLSIKMYDSMMDTLMYGNKYGDRKKGGPSKKTIATQKAVDAFQSFESGAMLGLNMFSMSVGFADAITRIFSESAMGKYMTPGDCLWALGTCLWYTPKCIANMFNPLANNKLTALMLMNGVSKGVYGTYVKADWGRGRKFLSNILMGGWSMLDWMANALLMAAFYHNIRFYEGLLDDNGDYIIDPGFYSKYDLQQAFLRAGRTKAEADKIHNGYSDILSTYSYFTLDKNGNNVRKQGLGRITLWDAYEFAPYVKDENGNVIKAHGEVRIKEQFAPYVTLKLKTRIATKTKKRGALYNGMNPDNDVPRWKRDVLGRLAGALRGWIVQLYQHLVAGGTDNVSRELETEIKYETTSSGTRVKKKQRLKKLTDEQRSKRFAWDYETGTPQDLILIGLVRSFRTLYKMGMLIAMTLPRTAKLSEVEKYAWKDSIIFLAMLAMMMIGWTYVHDDARTVQPPKNREEAGPASMLNPIDYVSYFTNVYIPNQYYKLGIDDIWFRTTEAKVSNIDPFLVSDILSMYTALKSGLDDQIALIGLGFDYINGDDADTIQKQGAYKFYTQSEKTRYRAFGFTKNLHTALTYYGAVNNLRWYTNKFGKFYRAFGYDFKQKDKQAQLENKRGGRNLSGRSLQGRNISGRNLSGRSL